MADARGFDDLFDGPMFRGVRSSAARAAPHPRLGQFPKSVSQMRAHTDFGAQGLHPDADEGYSAHVLRRPYAPGYGRGAPPPTWAASDWRF